MVATSVFFLGGLESAVTGAEVLTAGPRARGQVEGSRNWCNPQLAACDAQARRHTTNERAAENLLGERRRDEARHGALHGSRTEGDVETAVIEEPIQSIISQTQLNLPIFERLGGARQEATGDFSDLLP